MSLSHLSAAELARIDAICLRFESDLKAGKGPCIEQWLDDHAHVNRDLLANELAAVRAELSGETRGVSIAAADPCQEGLPGLEPGESVIRPGVHLGPYKVESLIGRGGMGRVYLGRDTRLDRSVAIKVLADDWAQRRDRVERFERESRAVAAMRHPNIVSLFDIGSHCGRPYAVMELLEGETLRGRIRRGPMSAAETRHVGAQAADALSAAHANGIIHRDLKPENLVLISPVGELSEAEIRDRQATSTEPSDATTMPIVKLLDFGLSRASDGDVEGEQDPTASGIVMGTAGYMAPEQARGEKATFAADIFGLGCVLFECFYHRPPFPGKTVAESLGAVLHAEPQSDAAIAATDPELAAGIRRCLSKQPQDRPQSAAEVARWLRFQTTLPASHGDANPTASVTLSPGHSIDKPSATNDAPFPWPRLRPSAMRLSRRRLAIWIAGATAAVAAGAYWFESGGNRPRIDSLAVLSLEVGEADSRQPVGSRELSEEEMIAAMLVNQLARQRSLKVVPFRPIRATSPQYAQLGEELGVDGLVLVRLLGEGQQRRVHLQLVEAATSSVLWGKEFQYGNSDSLLNQRDNAARIAEEIGLQIASIRSGGQTDDEQAFSCLVKGEARLDSDSEAGLRAALACFGNAREVDPLFAEAHAGYALAAMTLATVSTPAESKALVLQARSAMLTAIELQPDDPTSNLAAAMVHWRDDREFDLAEQRFRSALEAMPNSWHTQHEYALFAAAQGKTAESIAAANRAVTLNPLSQTLRIDEARLRWFAGQTELAKTQAEAVLAEDPSHRQALGLAIDLHEQNRKYDAAAALQNMSLPSDLRTDQERADHYFRQRQDKLSEYPYGPFGPVMNQAILDARRDRIDDAYLAKLLAERPTSLVLLMSAHPAFAAHRDRPIAQQVVVHST